MLRSSGGGVVIREWHARKAKPAADHSDSARGPSVVSALVTLSVAFTTVAAASGALPPVEAGGTVQDYVLPVLFGGQVTNNWGMLLGLSAWRSLVPLGGLAMYCLAVICSLTRSYGWLAAGGVALMAVTRIDHSYFEFTEGYYLYLGARIADGATLYRDLPSTQAPLLPVLISGLWRLDEDVFLTRLFATGCFLLAAALSGWLAVRLTGRRAAGPLATLMAAVLPLGASNPQILDANAVLAPLGVGVALLSLGGPMAAGASGIIAAFGIGTKLTFTPVAIAPLAGWLLAGWLLARTRRQPDATSHAVWLSFGVSLTAGLVLLAGVTYLDAGPNARDALWGELDSPMLPAGAALAALQFVQLEGLALVLAGAGWWRYRLDRRLAPAAAMAVTAVLFPLFAIHQGTFVSVARPAEPLIAAYAAAGILALPTLLARFRALAPSLLLALPPMATALVVALALMQSLTSAAPPVVVPVADFAGDEMVLIPPFLAATTHRRIAGDYADWTAWGRRARAGREPERDDARRLVAALERGALPVVIADFRLSYVPGANDALQRSYIRVAGDETAGGSAVALYLPRARDTTGAR